MKSRMSVIKFRWLLVIALVAALLGWLVTVLANRAGLPTPVLPYSALITLALVIVLVVILGVRVRRWRNGNHEKDLSPILAARTLILAQASAYAGAIILGWHFGALVDALTTTFYGASISVLGAPVALMLGSLAMVAAGIIVERFCRIPPEDGADSAAGSA
ncbi:DUF3180 domain-containing protein [Psychromicrobium lacuslunae]|uniref:Membrane protein n=1 Tax=Psychromicrobium lacuslunae TaxID=1618207 RepID=A0A0D4C190_9MICC|nr:DUF3180 domain-containing protein [Psychromicrobium lacuslunae]AJT42358.1 membrane protein [Psychromicrobium lacuslunae]